MPRFKAIIFDLDDTLYPERDYVLSGFKAVSNWGEERLGIPASQTFSFLSCAFAAGVRGDTFNRWLKSVGAPAALVPELIQAYRQHEPVLEPFPGVRDLLVQLGSRAALGLLSDGYLEVQRAKLAALALEPHFNAIVFSDELGRDAWKPSVRPFQVVLSRLGVAGNEAAYVADNPLKDFLGARSLGMATIWARHCAGDYASLRAPSPDHAADVTIELFPALSEYLLSSAMDI